MFFPFYRDAGGSIGRQHLDYHRQVTSGHVTPAELDRWADIELQHGHHHRVELLAHRAAELRQEKTQ